MMGPMGPMGAIAARRTWALRIAVLLAWHASAQADVVPVLESPNVIVIDAATGRELHGWHADEVRPIASMTKIFVAMALRRHHLALDQWTTINFERRQGLGRRRAHAGLARGPTGPQLVSRSAQATWVTMTGAGRPALDRSATDCFLPRPSNASC